MAAGARFSNPYRSCKGGVLKSDCSSISLKSTAELGSARLTWAYENTRNRPLHQLGPQAMALLVTSLRRAGLENPDEVPETLQHFDSVNRPMFSEVETRERPPIKTLPEYRKAHRD